MLKRLQHPQMALRVIAIFALLLIISSFVLEYVFNMQPCQLCWYQRYSHWLLFGVASIGALCPHFVRPSLWLTFLTAVGAFSLAMYHTLVELKVIAAPASCAAGAGAADNVTDFLASLATAAAPPSCADINNTIFGLSLANYNVLFMLAVVVLLLVTLIFNRQAK